MQTLSAPKSDLLFFLTYSSLEVSHDPQRHSDDVILRREPKNLEILRPAQAGLRKTIALFAEFILSLAEGLRMTAAGIQWVVGQILPFIFVRKKCRTSGMKFA